MMNYFMKMKKDTLLHLMEKNHQGFHACRKTKFPFLIQLLKNRFWKTLVIIG